jgi:putative flippase GtrA
MLFLIVGGINTVFGYGMFALFIFIGLHYAIAYLFATVLGILFNFFATGRLVFRNYDNRLMLRFFMVYSIVYLCNVGILTIFKSFNVSMYIAGAILILPVAATSYLMMKRYVFGKPAPKVVPKH